MKQNNLINDCGITRKKFAELCGVSLHTANKWFSKGNMPKKYNNIIKLVILKMDEIDQIITLGRQLK